MIKQTKHTLYFSQLEPNCNMMLGGPLNLLCIAITYQTVLNTIGWKTENNTWDKGTCKTIEPVKTA